MARNVLVENTIFKENVENKELHIQKYKPSLVNATLDC